MQRPMQPGAGRSSADWASGTTLNGSIFLVKGSSGGMTEGWTAVYSELTADASADHETGLPDLCVIAGEGEGEGEGVDIAALIRELRALSSDATGTEPPPSA